MQNFQFDYSFSSLNEIYFIASLQEAFHGLILDFQMLIWL